MGKIGIACVSVSSIGGWGNTANVTTAREPVSRDVVLNARRYASTRVHTVRKRHLHHSAYQRRCEHLECHTFQALLGFILDHFVHLDAIMRNRSSVIGWWARSCQGHFPLLKLDKQERC
jgi:hypothetical protein